MSQFQRSGAASPSQADAAPGSAEYLQLLVDAAAELFASADPGPVLRRTCDRLAALLQLDGYFHYELSDSTPSRLVLTVHAGVTEAEADRIRELELGELVCGAVARDGSPLVLQDVGDSVDTMTAVLRELRVNAYACFPMCSASNVLGTLSFFRRGRARFTPDELSLLHSVADMVGMTIERSQAGEALRRSEERFRATFDQAAVGLAQVSLDGRWLRVNDRLCEIVGYTREELLALTFQDITYAGDLEADLEQADRLLSGHIDCYALEKRYVRRDGSLVWINLTGSLVRDEERAPSYFIAVVEEIERRKRAEDAVSFLVEAGRLLSQSLDVNTVLDAMLRLALPRLGDYAVIDLLDEDGVVSRSCTAHVDPEKDVLAREYRRRYPPGPRNPNTPIWQVIETGEPLLANDLGESYVHEIAASAEQARLLRVLRPRAIIVTPLMGGGRAVGAMSFCISESERRYSEGDLALACELCARAAVALENARLHRRAQQELRATDTARAWAERLQALTSDFARVLRAEEVWEVVTGRMRETVGAVGGGVLLRTADGRELEIVHVAGWEDHADVVSRWQRIPYEAGTPVVDAMERRSLLLIESLEELRGRYPRIAPALERAGFGAFVVVPLEVEGQVVGALNYNFRGDHHFALEERGFLAALGRQAALAFHRAALFTAELGARQAAEAASVKAEAASRAKSQFLSTMSHELRTPLTAVIGLSDLLESEVIGGLNARQKEYLSRIKGGAWHLVTIIDEILTFTRAEAGREEIRLAPVDVAEIARGVMHMLLSDAEARGLQLKLRGAEERLVAVTDGGKVRQILVNLVGNALKFTEAGEVEVGLQADAECFTLLVRDTGPGIPPDRLADVFEPFVQLDGSTTRTKGGTGLGLTICRRQARLMGGDVMVDSAPGTGSRFVVRLPRYNPAPAAGGGR